MLIRKKGLQGANISDYTNTSLQDGDCVIQEGVPVTYTFKRKVDNEIVKLYLEDYDGMESIVGLHYSEKIINFSNDNYSINFIEGLLAATNLIALEISFEESVLFSSENERINHTEKNASVTGSEPRYFVLCRRE